MKTKFRQDLNETYLQVEMPVFYEEDYQISMLQVNKIEGLLPMVSKGIDGKSYYSYEVGGMVSMKSQYDKMKIEREDMESLIVRLVQVIQNVKNYMLNAERILLAPEYIFCRNDTFYFCYLPVEHKKLCQSFHELTEYFVSQVNYEKTDAVRLAVALHKASMEENYDIEQILEEFHKTEESERPDVCGQERGNIFELEDEDEDFTTPYRIRADVQTLQEMNGALGWIKRNLRNKKREKWGVWEGLITEDEMSGIE
ncbi:MAG: DUF6382 domain-containing protein [Hespellia sp.]|nr:DUF6382 domain-containing protein [Hespellia sp.]